MEVRELRIGNLVYFNGNHNEIGVVSEIIKKGVTKFTPYKIGINHRIDIYYEIDKLEPIPLTEEWLLKFSFKIEKQYECDFASIGVFTISFGENFFYEYTNLKYVHQLQNLYFALTNEELTLKS